MAKRSRSKPRPSAPSAPANSQRQNTSGFRADLRTVLHPSERWQWWLHAYVLVVASWYWISALWSGSGASLAELVLYRPHGDTQLYPLIQALGELNLGDPVDSLRYGQGISSFPLPPLLPYAAAVGLLGPAGYIVTDALMPWCFFVAAMLLLRACGLGERAALVTGAWLATGGARSVGHAIGLWYDQLLHQMGVMVWDQGLPNLLELPVYSGRIHRPQATAIVLMVALYLLLKLWRTDRAPGLARGLVLGAVMTLLFQGELYATAALGLLAVAAVGRGMIRHRWRPPWKFIGGGILGALCAGCYMMVQRLIEHPDVPARFGLVGYPRWPLLWLPRYGWMIRVGVIAVIAAAIAWRTRRDVTPHQLVRSVAAFFTGLMIVAALAQPIQIALTGSQIQIYHYLHNVSVFYGYSAVILGFHLVRLLAEPLAVRAGWMCRWGTRAVAVCLLGAGAWLVAGENQKRHAYQRHPSGASALCHPWAKYEDRYRPALRDLDREFRSNPLLREAKSFAAFNLDVFTLLTSFHGKHAFNPDVFASTLSDRDIEYRLMTAGLVMQVHTNNYHPWMTQYHMLNHFLGCNKYRYADDYRYSTNPNDYPPEFPQHLKADWYPLQDGWVLVMPTNEGTRLKADYAARPSYMDPDKEGLPDLFILSPEHGERRDVFALHPGLYEFIYGNDVFEVHRFLR